MSVNVGSSTANGGCGTSRAEMTQAFQNGGLPGLYTHLHTALGDDPFTDGCSLAPCDFVLQVIIVDATTTPPSYLPVIGAPTPVTVGAHLQVPVDGTGQTYVQFTYGPC